MGILGGSDIDRIKEGAIDPLESNLNLKIKEKLNSTIGTENEKPLDKMIGFLKTGNDEIFAPMFSLKPSIDAALGRKSILGLGSYKGESVVDDRYIYNIVRETGQVVKLDAYTLELVAQSPVGEVSLNGDSGSWASTGDENYIYFAYIMGQQIAKVDKHTLVKVIDSPLLGGRPECIVQDENYLYCVGGNKVHKLAKSNLGIVATSTTTVGNTEQIAFDEEYLYVANGSKITKLRKSNLGLVLTAPSNYLGGVRAIVCYKDFLYFATDDYSLNVANKTTLEIVKTYPNECSYVTNIFVDEKYIMYFSKQGTYSSVLRIRNSDIANNITSISSISENTNSYGYVFSVKNNKIYLKGTDNTVSPYKNYTIAIPLQYDLKYYEGVMK